MSTSQVQYNQCPTGNSTSKEAKKTKESKSQHFQNVLDESNQSFCQPSEIVRQIPVPVEIISNWKYRMPLIKSSHKIKHIPIYVPRFIEIPIPSAYLSDSEIAEAKDMYAAMTRITKTTAPSLCDLEELSDIVQKKAPSIIRSFNSKKTNKEIERKIRQHLSDVSQTTSSKENVC